jgi:hypothetical protein
MDLTMPKCAIGSFPNQQQIKSALDRLQQNNFPVSRVSILAQEPDQNDPAVVSKKDFIRTKTIAGIAKGSLLIGTIGALIGLIIVIGLAALPQPGTTEGITPITLFGSIFTGSLYGGLAGVFFGAIFGYGYAQEQIKPYGDRLANGNYLVVINGSQDELHQAQSVLNDQGIQDWGLYNTV